MLSGANLFAAPGLQGSQRGATGGSGYLDEHTARLPWGLLFMAGRANQPVFTHGDRKSNDIFITLLRENKKCVARNRTEAVHFAYHQASGQQTGLAQSRH